MNENEKMIMQLAQDVAFIKATLIGDVTTMKEDIKNIESKLEKESEKTSEIHSLFNRVEKLESIIEGATKLIVGGVVTALLGLVLATK